MAIADWNVTAKSGLSCYLWKIQRFPMMEPHEEYALAKRWREHGDHEAAHKLVNRDLRRVWIRASIGQYVLRSWSLVNMAATANRKKLFFNLRAAKSKISVFDNGDIRHDQVETIAKRLGVTEQEGIDMNGWLSGDASLNAPIR